METLAHKLEHVIRSIPDYPKSGIIFRDITTLLTDAEAFRESVDALVAPWQGAGVELVAGVEARGFILGGAIAHQLGAGFLPVRKKGKLPCDTIEMEYELEYGTDVIEIHRDAIKPGQKVILVDDLIATGGTAVAAAKLLQQAGAHIVSAAFVVDLPDLGGKEKLEALGVPVRTLVEFAGH
ncbi:adenine phosphoribosyltransferase [Polycladidibacter hongkongensis]|uniref:adenine phosphoribosyltransferase n=1 Tax=Polycladidibacter hongkongensis TaxID=1647556 RepID=UPI00083070BB|nr:adenine phosphoribosyltransferase [Pseudovibrio hongkongensis]